MKQLREKLKNEKGALSFEFLGILPFFFLFFLILWQVVASGYAIFTIKAAVNEGAKTFAITQDISEAEDTIVEAIGVTPVINYKKMDVVYLNSNGKFKLNLEVKHPLVFVPKQWKTTTALDLKESTVSQVLVK